MRLSPVKVKLEESHHQLSFSDAGRRSRNQIKAEKNNKKAVVYCCRE